MGATEVTYAIVMGGMKPNCEATRDKVDVGNTKPDGAEAEVGVSVRGIDTGMSYINLPKTYRVDEWE
ncbi:hypothetical protein KI387_036710, partial [Taxus chinensis]